MSELCVMQRAGTRARRPLRECTSSQLMKALHAAVPGWGLACPRLGLARQALPGRGLLTWHMAKWDPDMNIDGDECVSCWHVQCHAGYNVIGVGYQAACDVIGV